MTTKIAFLVLAYRSPLLLGQLARWLSQSSDEVLVHVDKRYEEQSFLQQVESTGRFVSERFACVWGTWGRIAASLELLQEALRGSATHFALVSEDSFPLHNPENLAAQLSHSSHHLLMDLEAMGSPAKPLSRISTQSRFQGDPRSTSLVRKALARSGIGNKDVDWRKHLGSLVPYAGDSWWVITRAAAEEIVSFASKEKEKVQFFSSTWIADEHFFQTILGNSSTPYVFAGTPMYADWDPTKSRHLPRFLGAGDRQALRAARTSFLFARKLEEASGELAKEIPRIWSD